MRQPREKGSFEQLEIQLSKKDASQNVAGKAVKGSTGDFCKFPTVGII